jgi:trimeric autotransporter adhesin
MFHLRPLLQLGIGSALLGLLISCGGGGGSSSAVLQSIEITPAAGSLAAGTTSQLMATGIYSDGGHRDVTYDAAWSSSSSAVANVGPGGVATAASQGSTKVSATFQGVTGTATLTVTAATLVSVEVTPSIPSIANGRTLQFVATGVFSDSTTQNLTSQVTWSSSDSTIATVSTSSGSNGLATAVGVGSATITATSGTISGGTKLTVTGAVLTAIQITPAAPSLAKGVTQPLVAMGIFSDNTKQNLTTQVAWSSSATGVATVSNSAPTNGTVTAIDIGTSMLTASASGVSASVQVIVTPATLVSLQVVPPTSSVAAGLTKQFTATGIYTDNSTQNVTTTATWASTAAAVASVSNATGSQGLATSATPGSATISAALGGVSGSSTLTVTPATLVSISVTPINPTIAKGLTAQMGATGTYTDHTTQNLASQVTFASAAQGVATVSNDPASKGLAQSVTVGSTVVTATLGSVSGTTTLTVGAAQLVSIVVTASNHTISGVGLTQQFVATGTYTDQTTVDITTQVVWGPTASAVATVSNAPVSEGLATSGTGLGTINITATSGAISGMSTLTVAPAILQSIEITPPSLSLFETSPPTQLNAIGHYNDLSTMNLTNAATWASNFSFIAFVSTTPPTKGLVTAGTTPGGAIISATFGGITGSANVSVTEATVQSIAVSIAAPVSNSTSHSVTQQATAMGTYDDLSVHDVTTSADWTSSDTSVATVDPHTGVITWVGIGGFTVTAAVGSVSGSASFTITTPTGLTLSPASQEVVGIGGSFHFVLKGDVAGVNNLDVSRLATWSSSQTGVAQIDNTGLASSLNTFDSSAPALVDTTTIQATLAGITRTSTLKVDQSFTQGSEPIYGAFSAETGGMGNPSALTCNNCHTVGTPAPGTTAFYVAGDSAATYSNLSTLGDLGSIFALACGGTPPGIMPDYRGTPFCLAVKDWTEQGSPDN